MGLNWDKIFTTRPVERKLRLHMGKVLTSADMCTLFRVPVTAENRIDFGGDLSRMVEKGELLRFWVGTGHTAEIGYAWPQPVGKDEETGEPLPPPPYVHDSGLPVAPY